MRADPWPEPIQARLIELWRAGASVRAIAKTVCKPERACISKAYRLREQEIPMPMRKPNGKRPA